MHFSLSDVYYGVKAALCSFILAFKAIKFVNINKYSISATLFKLPLMYHLLIVYLFIHLFYPLVSDLLLIFFCHKTVTFNCATLYCSFVFVCVLLKLNCCLWTLKVSWMQFPCLLTKERVLANFLPQTLHHGMAECEVRYKMPLMETQKQKISAQLYSGVANQQSPHLHKLCKLRLKMFMFIFLINDSFFMFTQTGKGVKMLHVNQVTYLHVYLLVRTKERLSCVNVQEETTVRKD